MCVGKLLEIDLFREPLSRFSPIRTEKGEAHVMLNNYFATSLIISKDNFSISAVDSTIYVYFFLVQHPE